MRKTSQNTTSTWATSPQLSLSRRSFVRGLSGAAAATVLLPHLGLAETPATGFRAIRGDVGYFWGRGGTIGWLISPDAVAVVDSQFVDPAKIFLAGVQEKTEHGIDVLFNTHHHADHTGGNGVFRKIATRIVAQVNVPALQKAQAVKRDTLADQTYASETFRSDWSLELGGETIVARHDGPAHTGGDAVPHFEEANVAHVGDLVFNRIHPFIDVDAGGSPKGWLATLEKIIARFDQETVFIFGHAAEGFERTGDLDDIRLQRDYLSAVIEIADKAVKSGRARSEAAKIDAVPGFEHFTSFGERFTASRNIALAWDEISGLGGRRQ